MIGVSVSAWLAATAVLGMQTGVAVLLGMLAPLAMAVGSWVAIERVYRRSPAAVTRLMMAAFAGKMVFFGAYVVVVLGGLTVQPLPFIVSFTTYFIGLYLVEALWLRRLFMESGVGKQAG
jgi:hypothetical protein